MTLKRRRSTTSQQILEAPAYSMAEAARIVGIPASTVRAWCLGQRTGKSGRGAGFQPVIQLDDPEGKYLSFRNLVEIHVLTAIRRQFHVSLQSTRRAAEFIKKHLGSEHPLASQEMLTNGRDLLIKHGEHFLNLSQAGQMELGLVAALLSRVELNRSGLPIRLFPFTRPEPEDAPRTVVVDPRVQFGRPCLRGTGVPTDVIASRFHGGESIEDLAADYNVSAADVQDALRFEGASRAA